MNKRGMSKMMGLLIEVGLIILIALYFIMTLGSMSEHATSSMATGGSAADLSMSINNVYDCYIKFKDDPDTSKVEDCEEEVRISIPQNTEGWLGGSMGDDPLWIIWHDRNLGSMNKDAGCPPAKCECHSWWDQGFIPAQCDDALCWGLVETTDGDEAKEILKPGAADKLESFYIIDPCYSLIKVYYDRTDDAIEICFESKISGPWPTNFCYTNDEGCLAGDHNWADKCGVFTNNGCAAADSGKDWLCSNKNP